MASTYWADRIETVKAQIAAFDAAILALEGGQQSYTLDTGQTRVTKTKFDVGSLKRARDSLLSELAVLEVRTGAARGSFYGRPL